MLNKPDLSPPASRDSHLRSVIKGVTWRIVGTLDTLLLSWFYTGSFTIAAAIGGTEVFTKVLLYYGHERLWQGVGAGKLERISPWFLGRTTVPGREEGLVNPIIRRVLGVILSVLALNAVGGGIYALSGAEEIPRSWLEGSPFADYTAPGIFLMIVIGGSSLTAAVLVWMRRPEARPMALLAGLLALTWILIQLAVIGYVSPLQPAVLVSAACILVLAWNLRVLPVPGGQVGHSA